MIPVSISIDPLREADKRIYRLYLRLASANLTEQSPVLDSTLERIARSLEAIARSDQLLFHLRDVLLFYEPEAKSTGNPRS